MSHRGPHGSEHWAFRMIVNMAKLQGPHERFHVSQFTSVRSRAIRPVERWPDRGSSPRAHVRGLPADNPLGRLK
jgi:hypothetical protein